MSLYVYVCDRRLGVPRGYVDDGALHRANARVSPSLSAREIVSRGRRDRPAILPSRRFDRGGLRKDLDGRQVLDGNYRGAVSHREKKCAGERKMSSRARKRYRGTELRKIQHGDPRWFRAKWLAARTFN